MTSLPENRPAQRRRLACLGLLPIGLCIAALCIAGCSGDEDTGASGGSEPTPAPTVVGCRNDARTSPFTVGLEAKSASGKVVARVVGAIPEAPRAGAGDAGLNAWTLEVKVDGMATSLPLTVGTWMPDHGHKSPKPSSVTQNADGTFTVSNLFLFMAGVWEITVATATPADGATFTVCVE